MLWCFPQAACSSPGSCPSRAGRYGSPRSSLTGQVWTAAATLPRDPCPEGLGCLGVILPNSPEAEHTPATITRLLAASQQSSLCLYPGATSPTVFGGACQECSAKRPPGLTQRRNFQAGSSLETNWGEVIQPQASPCAHAQKRTCRGPAKIIIKTESHVEFSYFQA